VLVGAHPASALLDDLGGGRADAAEQGAGEGAVGASWRVPSRSTTPGTGRSSGDGVVGLPTQHDDLDEVVGAGAARALEQGGSLDAGELGDPGDGRGEVRRREGWRPTVTTGRSCTIGVPCAVGDRRARAPARAASAGLAVGEVGVGDRRRDDRPPPAVGAPQRQLGAVGPRRAQRPADVERRGGPVAVLADGGHRHPARPVAVRRGQAGGDVGEPVHLAGRPRGGEDLGGPPVTVVVPSRRATCQAPTPSTAATPDADRTMVDRRTRHPGTPGVLRG
jgi:hypothetical protein